MAVTLESLRAEVVDYIRLRLGDGIVDVELDPEDPEVKEYVSQGYSLEEL